MKLLSLTARHSPVVTAGCTASGVPWGDSGSVARGGIGSVVATSAVAIGVTAVIAAVASAEGDAVTPVPGTAAGMAVIADDASSAGVAGVAAGSAVVVALGVGGSTITVDGWLRRVRITSAIRAAMSSSVTVTENMR